MNLILLDNTNTRQILGKDDPRALHIEKYLLGGLSDTVYVGCPDQSLGKARVERQANGDLILEIGWGIREQTEPLLPLTLIVGLSRPQTCRKILRELAPLGIKKAHFVMAAKSEPSYIRSKLWTSREWEQQLHEGIEQAFNVLRPQVVFGESLESALLSHLPDASTTCICLDNYEGQSELLAASEHLREKTVLAIGPEGGWNNSERELFRKKGYQMVHLGKRVLRTESAVIAAGSLLAAQYRCRLQSFDE